MDRPDPRTVPPGLSDVPEPGTAVLSPGLRRDGYSASDFGLAESAVGLGADGAIGSAGVISESEYWVYARPSPGRTLGEGGALLQLAGYGIGGETASFDASPDMPTQSATALGSLILLIIPAFVLLIGGARSNSSVRTERAQTLLKYGVAMVGVRVVLLLEGALLALSGSLIGATVWVLGLLHVTGIPLTATKLHDGALVVAPRTVALVVLLVLGLAGLGAAWLGRDPGNRVRSRALRTRAARVCDRPARLRRRLSVRPLLRRVDTRT